jgi:hypothetical protein
VSASSTCSSLFCRRSGLNTCRRGPGMRRKRDGGCVSSGIEPGLFGAQKERVTRHCNVPFVVRDSRDRKISSVKRRIKPRRRAGAMGDNSHRTEPVRGCQNLEGSGVGANRRNQHRHGLRKVNDVSDQAYQAR